MVEWFKEWGFMWVIIAVCIVGLALLFVHDYTESTRAAIYCASVDKYPVQTGNDYICVPGESVK
jgi:hypothetical protein